MRDAFGRARGTRVVLLVVAAAAIAACSLFVDLSGLGDGSRVVAGDAGADGLATSDAPTNGDAQSTLDAASKFPSCNNDAAGAGAGCGANHATDCCQTLPVPGGNYNRYNNVGFPATVSPFLLDRFEVTVGRFRQFVNQGGALGASTPSADAGAAPLVAGSGWNSSWAALLSGTTAALSTALDCQPTATWTDAVGANEEKPINCMTWYEAFAFCVWDGGRLPTDSEWGFAASGGAEQRIYAWGNQPPDATRTAFIDGGPLLSVGGYSPLGDAKWGQSEMTSNVQERVLDWYSSPLLPTTCNDCAELTITDGGGRMERGGSFTQPIQNLPNSHVDADFPELRYAQFGFRCARAN